MEIRFADFCFVPEKLALYQQGQFIPLKRNQALLLDFLLSQPGDIHSKEAILDTVWQGKVVSEQVVFQTISQLRGILGNEAIKTHSRQGYRWQLPIQNPDVEAQLTAPSQLVFLTGKKTTLRFAFVLFTAVIVGVLLWSSLSDTEVRHITYHILEREDGSGQFSVAELFQNALKTESPFSYQPAKSTSSVTQAFATPHLVWQQYKQPDHWLFWGQLYPAKQGIFLHYGLAKEQLHWQGYVFGQNRKQLQQALTTRFRQLDHMGLFSAPAKSLALVELAGMQKLQPDDPDLTLRLAGQYINIGQPEIALTLLQRLLTTDDSYASKAMRAQAYWTIGKVYKMRGQHLQADNSLAQMAETLEDTPLWALRLHQVKTRAWLAYDKEDYDTMYQTLEQGLSLARAQQDPLILFRLHILYSTLAERAGHTTKKYHHLNQAQVLLLKHELDDSNLAVVFYYFALFAEDKSQAVSYWQRILEFARSEDNYWIQERAFESLFEYYLKQQDFSAAAGLFQASETSPVKLVLRARLLLQTEKVQQAQLTLEKAFELAKLTYDKQTSLRAALMLYQLSAHRPKRQAEYLAYLQANANSDWLARHQPELASQ